jgi:TPR repeat protein
MSAEDDRLYLEKAAEQGDAKAQSLLGLWYLSEDGGQKDYVNAAEWFGKAAKQGDAQAQYYMGLLYFNGLGVPKDNTKAAEWSRKAGEQGDEKARNLYAKVLAETLINDPKMQVSAGVEAYKTGNYARAAELFSKAAEQGNDTGQYCLGILYEEGVGVPKDSVKANELISKAAEQGNTEAKDHLAKAEAELKAREEKETAKRAAAEKAREAKEAEAKLRTAAAEGDADAQYKLGMLYFNEDGVPKHWAAEWFGRAAAQGHAEAKDFLAKAEAIIEEEKAREAKEAAERAVKAKEKAEREREIEAAREKRAMQDKWLAQGLCFFCGGKLAAFTKKCKSCGKKN